jgi:hypothetical protein
MSRRPALVTQADVARAIRAAQQCGAGPVEIKPDGTIRIMPSPESTAASDESPVEPQVRVVL